jgi:REP element-mobilizing transposase RayT
LGHAYASNLIHLIYSTKERQPLITTALEKPLRDYLVGIGQNQKMPVLGVGGIADHVHMLFSLPATVSLAKSIQTFKANSSRFMRQHNPRFAWQEGYGAFSVSQSNRKTVLNYIDTQAEHHKKLTFADEFIALLRKHEVDFDPRFVLD